MKLSIELPEVVEFSSRDVPFAFNFADVVEDKLAEFVVSAAIAGIQKAGVDAASSAVKYAGEHDLTEAEATEELINKKMTVWKTGEWTARGVGNGFNSVEREAISLCRKVVKDGGDKVKYKNASPEERTKMVEAYFEELPENQKEAYLKAAKASVERKASDAKREAEALAALKIAVEI